MKMTFLHRFPKLCLGLMASTLGVEGLRADLLIYEPFDSDPGTVLLGNEGGSGFVTPYEEYDSGFPEDLDYVKPGSLSYAGLQTSGNSALSVAINETGSPLIRETENAAGPAGSTTWVSFLFALEGSSGPVGPLDGFLFAMSAQTLFGSSSSAYLGLYQSGGDLYFGIGNSSAGVADLSSTAFVPGDVYFVVASIEWDGNGTDEVIHLYLNPVPGGAAPDPSMAIASTSALGIDLPSSNTNQLDNIAIFTADIGTEWAFDEIRIGQTFADVAPFAIPEPSTLALIGVGVLNLAFRRRSRAAGQPVPSA